MTSLKQFFLSLAMVAGFFTLTVFTSGCETTTPPAGDCTVNDIRRTYSAADKKTVGVGICRTAIETCESNIWVNQQNEVLPGVETCNGSDDDCDGRIDNVPNITCQTNQFATPAILTTATSATTSTTDTILLAGTVTDPEEGVASVVLDNLVLTPRQEVLADLPSQSGGVINWAGAVSLNSGANVVKVTATNNEGQETVKEILIVYTPPTPADITPPTAVVSVSSPATATTSTFTFTVTGMDSGGAVASATCSNISANGSTVTVTGTTPTWLVSATLTETTVFSCTVVDGAGNRSVPVPVTVRYTPVIPKDTTPPTITINTPSAVSLTPTITLTGSFSEAGEMDKVVVTNLTATTPTMTLAAFTGSLWVASGVPLVAVGQNVLSVVGVDKDSNASAVQYVYVNYEIVTPDTEKPVIAVALVSPAVATSSAFSFVGTASDNAAVSAVSCFNASGNGSTVSVTGTTAWAATMSLVQGTTVLICSAVDSNNLRSDTKTIVIAYNVPASTDTTAPVVDVTSPSASSVTVIVGSATLMGSATDGESAIVEVTATNLATGTTTVCPTTGATARTRAFTCSVVLEENINTITVASKDTVGNVGTKNVNIKYDVPNTDTTAPVLTIATASPATATASAFTFDGVALDLVGVTSVTCRNISGNASTVTVTGTATWTASATLATGSTTFACQAKDARGNDSAPGIMVATYTPVTPVDTVPPTVTIAASATSAVDTITVSGSATDNTAVTAVTVTNITAGSSSAPATLNTVAGSVTWTIPVTLVLGSNRISAVSRDAVGNVSTVQYVVVVYAIPLDTTKPTIVITTTSPAAATSSVFSFAGTAADAVGVTSVTCSVLASNGSICATPVGTNSWAVGATLADGITVFAVQSKDAAGNTSDPVIMQVAYNIVVNPADTTAPTVTITAPASATVTSNLLTLTGAAGDNVGVSKVTVANITTGVGRLATLGGSATTATWTVPVTLVSGSNLISAVSEDSSGRPSNPAYVTVTYTPPVTTADITKPTAVVTTATPATVTSNAFSFAGTASDNTGVTSVTCSVVSGPGSSCSAPVGTTSWVVGATLATGTTIFAIVSHDAAGNSSDPATIQVTYTPPTGTTADTTIPTVAVATPPNITSNVATFSGVAGDNVGVTAVLVSNTTTGVLNIPATLIGTGGSITWTAGATLASGNNIILVVSRDAAGNSSLAATVTVNNTGTGGSTGGGSTGGGIIPSGSGIVPTGKYEVICVVGSSADCKVTVWNESTDYPLATSARVSVTPRQFCFGSLIDTPSGDRVHVSSSSGSDKVRVYYPNGEPVLDPVTGSPVLKLSQALGFTSRARLGTSDLRCSDFY